MAINASFKSKNSTERKLSNLSHTPFVFEGRECDSFEGFYQGIKRSGDDIQNHIFKTSGIYAKNYSKPTKFVYFNGKTFRAGSKEHHELLFQAQLCKYTHNKEAREALLSTGNAKLTHKVGGKDSIFYPARVYTGHLTAIRGMLQRGEV